MPTISDAQVPPRYGSSQTRREIEPMRKHFAGNQPTVTSRPALAARPAEWLPTRITRRPQGRTRPCLALTGLALCAAVAARAADSGAPDAEATSAGASGMGGALGTYPFTREASGTSWLPDVSEHAGIHLMEGDWMVMTHALLNGVDDWQQGPRGADKAFVSGMLMAAAMRPVTDQDTIRFRAMLSPDPLMGKTGLPLLLASGETANGVTPLVDRQHPHDLFMELSGSESHAVTPADSVFVYAGLPGEPAFGPPAFMHRLSIEDSPEETANHSPLAGF